MSSSWSRLQPATPESPGVDDGADVVVAAPDPSVPDATAAEIGERVRRARVQAGLSQTELAGDGMSASYVSRIEAGQRMPTRAVLEQLAARLGCDVEFLLTGVSPDREAELRLRLRYAQLALESGEAAEAEQQFRGLLAEDGLRGELHVEAVWGLGRALETLGRLEDAVVVYERARAASGVGSELWMRAVMDLCRCYREVGDLSRAVDLGERAMAEVEQLGLEGSDAAVRLAVTLLSVYFERGDVVRAAALAQEAMGRADATGSSRARAAAYWNASMVAHRRGRVADAARWAERALALLSEGIEERNLSLLRQAYARMLLEMDSPDPSRALVLLEQAAQGLAASSGSTLELAHGEIAMAMAQLLLGQLPDAEEHVARSLELLGDQPRLETAEAYAARGRIAFARGDHEAAVTSFRQAVAVLTGMEGSRTAAVLWNEIAAMFDAVGRVEEARDAYRAATACLGLVAPAVTRTNQSTRVDLPM